MDVSGMCGVNKVNEVREKLHEDIELTCGPSSSSASPTIVDVRPNIESVVPLPTCA